MSSAIPGIREYKVKLLKFGVDFTAPMRKLL